MSNKREATYESATRELLSIALNEMKEVAESQIQREFRTLSSAWGSIQLFSGTLEILKPILTANLQRIGKETGFRYFDVYHDENGGNAGVMACFPQMVVPVRIWKCGLFFHLCGNSLFHGI